MDYQVIQDLNEMTFGGLQKKKKKNNGVFELRD